VLAHKAGSLGSPDLLGNWLYGVACRTSQAARSAARRRGPQPPELADASPGPVEEAARCELRRVIDEELGRLPEKYRAPLVLCYLEGLSRPEAAHRLGWPEGTVAGRLARARALLEQRLSRRGAAVAAVPLAAFLVDVPANLAAATFRNGLLAMAGQGVPGLIPASVLTLTQGAMRTMFIGKLKAALAVAAALILTAGATAAALWRERPALPPASDAPPPARGEKDPAKPGTEPGEKGPDVRLPKDGTAIVISLDYQRANAAAKRRDPVLVIRADGAARLYDVFGTKKVYEGKLSRKALQALLRLAVHEQKFFEADTRKVQEKLMDAVRDAGIPWVRGLDLSAPTTHLRIHADGKEQEVICPSVKHCAGRWKVKEVKRLYEIQNKLDGVIEELKAGKMK
jgi:hypothetical protein